MHQFSCVAFRLQGEHIRKNFTECGGSSQACEIDIAAKCVYRRVDKNGRNVLCQSCVNLLAKRRRLWKMIVINIDRFIRQLVQHFIYCERTQLSDNNIFSERGDFQMCRQLGWPKISHKKCPVAIGSLYYPLRMKTILEANSNVVSRKKLLAHFRTDL